MLADLFSQAVKAAAQIDGLAAEPDAYGGRKFSTSNPPGARAAVAADLPHRSAAARCQCRAAGENDLDDACGDGLVVGDELHGHEGTGDGIALLNRATPGVEAGLGQVVPFTEGTDRQTTVLPLADPAAPLLLFARIARFTLGHGYALLSNGITPCSSRTLFTGQTHLACAVGLPGAEDLDIAETIAWVDDLTYGVSLFTNSMLPQFEENPAKFQQSAARFRMLAMAAVLQRDCGIRGRRSNPKLLSSNFANCEDHFLHGLMHGKGGCCANLPILYVAIGRRLGYPVELARTTNHMFARWQGADGERFNIECTVLGLDTPSDDYYLRWPAVALRENIIGGRWLEPMTPREVLADDLILRKCCLHANDRSHEAVEASIGACIAAPENTLHQNDLRKVVRAWQAKTWMKLPSRFPKVHIHVTGRTLPLDYSDDDEQLIARLMVIEALLRDPVKEKNWWQRLRGPGYLWPTGVPTSISLSIRLPPLGEYGSFLARLPDLMERAAAKKLKTLTRIG